MCLDKAEEKEGEGGEVGAEDSDEAFGEDGLPTPDNFRYS